MTRAERIEKEKIRKEIGSNFLIAVGINQYADGHGNLDNCINDARRIYGVFEEKKYLSMAPGSRLILSDQEGGTGKQALLNMLGELKGKLREKQNVVFYFSGHGCSIGHKFHFVVSDSTTRADTMISMDELLEALENLYVSTRGNITVLVDACRTTVGQAKGFHDKNHKYVVDHLSRARGRGIIYACTEGEEALDRFIKEPVSVFTSFLVDALNGQAAALEGNYLTFDALYRYLYEESNEVSRSCTQIRQHPDCDFTGNHIVYAVLDDEEIVYRKSEHAVLSFSKEITALRDEFLIRCELLNLDRGNYDPWSVQGSFTVAREICWDLSLERELPENWENTLAKLQYYSGRIDEKKEISIPDREKREILEEIRKFYNSLLPPLKGNSINFPDWTEEMEAECIFCQENVDKYAFYSEHLKGVRRAIEKTSDTLSSISEYIPVSDEYDEFFEFLDKMQERMDAIAYENCFYPDPFFERNEETGQYVCYLPGTQVYREKTKDWAEWDFTGKSALLAVWKDTGRKLNEEDFGGLKKMFCEFDTRLAALDAKLTRF